MTLNSIELHETTAMKSICLLEQFFGPSSLFKHTQNHKISEI